MRSRKLLYWTALGIFFTGCASTPNPALESARGSLEQARAAGVDRSAPLPFQEAQATLERAEEAWRDDEDESHVTHLATLADRRVQIARVEAGAQRERERVNELAEQRSEVLLDARTREVERLRQELDARQTERGLVVTLPDILFDVDRATLKPGAQATLARVADFLRSEPDRPVRIEGHTDSTGSHSYNEDLSRRRAESVADRLLSLGVETGRIEAVGFGETLPVASNETGAGRQQNRRVEIVIQNPPAVSSGPSAPAATGARSSAETIAPR
ncbi:MAG: hypothetical protein DCC71_03250 [Proteobacteria bacterium]|nr:MAG: hypothetical protein DCC71_03250 [Pseudomonadota bacterium]